ncbi:MAG: ATP-binding protein, partial [candidate division NC10 bacterium]|nr:ATP-binding protein [candidate division NC10 bacterium]
AIEVRSRDEIGKLARSFTRMTEKLKKTQEELVHLNADLQQKIRTLKETQAQLIHSEKLASLGQMSAAVAHGLRNPLASIRAATQLSLHRLPRKSPLGEHLRAVIGEVDRLEKRISQLLDFTKPVPFYPLLERVDRLVESVLTVFTEKMAQQQIRLKTDFRPDLPRVWIDPSQIEQALLEVISNALEAMPKGGTLNLLVGMECADGKEFVAIEVADDGEGIPEEALPHVFEPFFTTKADGTGLGLAIAKRFVEQHKGTMTIESKPGEGTSVRITLPVYAS